MPTPAYFDTREPSSGNLLKIKDLKSCVISKPQYFLAYYVGGEGSC